MAEAEKQVKVKTVHSIQHDGESIAPGTVVKAPKSVADSWVASGAAALYVADEAKPAPVETAEEKAVREAAELAGKSK